VFPNWDLSAAEFQAALEATRARLVAASEQRTEEEIHAIVHSERQVSDPAALNNPRCRVLPCPFRVPTGVPDGVPGFYIHQLLEEPYNLYNLVQVKRVAVRTRGETESEKAFFRAYSTIADALDAGAVQLVVDDNGKPVMSAKHTRQFTVNGSAVKYDSTQALERATSVYGGGVGMSATCHDCGLNFFTTGQIRKHDNSTKTCRKGRMELFWFSFEPVDRGIFPNGVTLEHTQAGQAAPSASCGSAVAVAPPRVQFVKLLPDLFTHGVEPICVGFANVRKMSSLLGPSRSTRDFELLITPLLQECAVVVLVETGNIKGDFSATFKIVARSSRRANMSGDIIVLANARLVKIDQVSCRYGTQVS
jgi:hypothetical protein